MTTPTHPTEADVLRQARDALAELVPMTEALLMIRGEPEQGSIGHKARAVLAAIDALPSAPADDLAAWVQSALSLPACDRLREWAAIGPTQLAAVESLAEMIRLWARGAVAWAGVDAQALREGEASAPAWPCHCDERGIGQPGVTCGDCPRDYGHIPASDTATRDRNIRRQFTGKNLIQVCQQHGVSPTTVYRICGVRGAAS